ncbi:MAG: substrate-binding domain-containing protein [Chloroflexi bacterium]|nr:substrate-binding domain-containing protein [Chloroflexota bacterium]
MCVVKSVLAALVVLAAACTTVPASAPRRDVLLATTTSFQDSGLLDVLVKDFGDRTGRRVRAAAVGTGAALAIGGKGDADVLVVHAPKAEREFMAAGNGDRRHLFMHNDFVVVGPSGDPAAIKGKPVFEALRRIASAGAAFISRGDRSGTHLLEMDLWERTGVKPSGTWYVEAATGMGQTLTIASEKRAYTLTDRGTYLARKGQLELGILVEKDPPLTNLYHVITVHPRKFPRVNNEGANAFADFLLSARAQELIKTFGVEKFGEPLFFPDAGKKEEDLE